MQVKSKQEFYSLAPEDDLLNGANEISRYLGWSEKRFRHKHAAGVTPFVFKIGGQLAARKSAILAWIVECEFAAMDHANKVANG